jgi:hypothetical protein
MRLSPRFTQWDQTVEDICLSWEGTAYRPNRSLRGSGVDCLHFAASVLDDLYGTRHSKDLNSLPPDACVHNKKGVIVAARALFEKYPSIERVRDHTVEAGDLVVFGAEAALNATQHLMVAGTPGRLWHASPPRVHYTGVVVPPNLKFVCSYRASDKEKWSC